MNLIDHFLFDIIVLIGIFLFFHFLRKKDLEKIHKKIEILTHTDELTQVYNRRKLDDILEEIKDKKYSIIILDIDDFKKINDTLGHLKGDKVLKKFAQFLKENTDSRYQVGRWGGEEFIIVCTKMNEKEACKMAKKLRNKISKTTFSNQKITASFGVCQSIGRLNIEDVLHTADVAMYKAKDQGKNRVICACELENDKI